MTESRLNLILKDVNTEKSVKCFKKCMREYIDKEVNELTVSKISKLNKIDYLSDYANQTSFESIDYAIDNCIGYNEYSKLNEEDMEYLERSLWSSYFNKGVDYFYEKINQKVSIGNLLKARRPTPRRRPARKTGLSALKNAYRKML